MIFPLNMREAARIPDRQRLLVLCLVLDGGVLDHPVGSLADALVAAHGGDVGVGLDLVQRFFGALGTGSQSFVDVLFGGHQVLLLCDLQQSHVHAGRLFGRRATSRDGKIFIDGKRISSYKSGALYQNLIAALPQDPHDIFICESVKEDISTSPDGEKYDLKTLRSLCERLNVSEKLLDLHPYDLSGGEIQRAALVKLLLLEPKILLLDEPTKGLDKQCKRQLSALLKELTAEGKAVIFITHDMDFITETADDVTLIFGGKAVSSLPVRQFIMQNSVYTTAASRIGRGYFDKTMTDSELISSAVSRKNERGDGDE